MYRNKRLTGFDAINLVTQERAPLARCEANSPRQSSRDFQFLPEGLKLGYKALAPGATKTADLVIVDQNPLENLKVLYGTGWQRLNDETGEVEWVGGVRYTIKDGIVYDAKQLLADVARMVDEQKASMTDDSGESRQ